MELSAHGVHPKTRHGGGFEVFRNDAGEIYVVSWNMMVEGFLQAGELESARRFIMKTPCPNAASWVTMLNALSRHGNIDEARRMFDMMQARNSVALNAMISGCASNGRMDKAVELLERMPTKTAFSLNTVIVGHARQGKMDEALEVFKHMKEMNTVSWNSIISGLTQNGFHSDALQHYVLMRDEGGKPDWRTYASCLTACAHLAALQIGKQLHLLLLKNGIAVDLFAGNALMNMYVRCGRISSARQVFDEIVSTDVISSNTLIVGYALNGFGRETISLFKEMIVNGFKPDEITFVGVLSSCSHARMIEKGLKYFNSMSRAHSVEPVAEHYASVVDLLGRAGRLEEAYKVVADMSDEANAGAWGALLGACRMHGNPDIANFAAEKLFEIEPLKTSSFVLLSNMHADDGRWEEVDSMRALMKGIGVQKQPGCSWINIKNEVCSFVSDDTMQPRTTEIGFVLEMMCAHM